MIAGGKSTVSYWQAERQRKGDRTGEDAEKVQAEEQVELHDLRFEISLIMLFNQRVALGIFLSINTNSQLQVDRVVWGINLVYSKDQPWTRKKAQFPNFSTQI
jgi:hypothetical protein